MDPCQARIENAGVAREPYRKGLRQGSSPLDNFRCENSLLRRDVNCAACWKLEFLNLHFLVCGIFYGIAIFSAMNLIVLPLVECTPLAPMSFVIGVPIVFA